MTQVSDAPPTQASCRALLRALPAFGAFKRAVYTDAPPDSHGWLGALSVVARHPDGIRPSGVAERLRVDLSVASRALSHLEERGYVRREPDPDDGRATRVHATDSGRAWIDEFADRFSERMQTMLTDWRDDEIVLLTDLLTRFGTSLEAHQR